MADYYTLEDVRKLSANTGKKYYTLTEVASAPNRELPPLTADPTEGMSGLDKFRAGIGKGMTDVARGVGQSLGLVSRDDVAESRKLDAPLKESGAGTFGDLVGSAALNIPLAFVPGANTMKGAALIGAGTGFMQPSTDTRETLQNTALGGAIGPAALAAGRTLGAGYEAAAGLMRPFSQSGQRNIAADVLRQSASDPAASALRAAQARPLVPGSLPTLGQASGDPGLAQLERSLRNNPQLAGPLNLRLEAQQQARQKAIGDVAGTDEYYNGIKQGRDVFARQDYRDAMAQGVDTDMAKAIGPQIESLMRRPSIQDAKAGAIRLAAENDQALTGFGSIQGLDWLKKSLDNKISAAASPGSAIGKEELRSLMQTKNDLMAVLEQVSPAYKSANDNFSAMSRQINGMDVARDLQNKLNKNAQYGATGRESADSYKTALANATESVKKQTGMKKSLDQVMGTGDIAALEAVAKDLARKQYSDSAGRAVGSNTVQNMMSQNLLRGVLGPTGLPESWAESTILQTLLRPYEFAGRTATPRIEGLLSEAMLDPKMAAGLLSGAAQPNAVRRFGAQTERFLPATGLLGLDYFGQ